MTMADESEEVDGLLGALAKMLIAKGAPPEASSIAAVEHKAPGGQPEEAEVLPITTIVQEGTPKRTVTPEHLQGLILAGLQKVEEFPKDGVSITVYGLKPWNAMITFAPGSVSSKTAATYRQMLPQLIEELRKQFDVE
jgi:hypothetical protein